MCATGRPSKTAKRYVQCFPDDGSLNGAWANIDTATGTVVTAATAMGTGSAAPCTVTPGPGTAMRIAISTNSNSAANWQRAGILQIDTSGAKFSASSAGDGVSGYLVSGSQVEVGAYPTSCIPTSGSAVTRSQDVARIDARHRCRSYATVRQHGEQCPGRFQRHHFSKSVELFKTNISALQKIATVQTYSTALGTPTIGAIFKVGIAFATGSQIGTLNATAPTTLATGAIPAGLNTLCLGRANSG